VLLLLLKPFLFFSAVMRELAQELAGAPEEVTPDLPGMDTAAAVAARQRLEARAAAEEELMLRVPLSKAEAKKLKAQRRCVGPDGVVWWGWGGVMFFWGGGNSTI
jgi:hypothetical protein